MHRRSFLFSSVITVSATSGCFGFGKRIGGNKRINVVNNYQKNVQLNIHVELNKPAGSQNSETVYDETVTIPANETKHLDVLGDNQYRITVTMSDEKVSFFTRPICNSARTIVIVTHDGGLTNEVEFCE